MMDKLFGKAILMLAAMAMLLVFAGCPAEESADNGSADTETAIETDGGTDAGSGSEDSAESDEGNSAEQMASAEGLSPREAFAAEVADGAG